MQIYNNSCEIVFTNSLFCKSIGSPCAKTPCLRTECNFCSVRAQTPTFLRTVYKAPGKSCRLLLSRTARANNLPITSSLSAIRTENSGWIRTDWSCRLICTEIGPIPVRISVLSWTHLMKHNLTISVKGFQGGDKHPPDLGLLVMMGWLIFQLDKTYFDERTIFQGGHAIIWKKETGLILKCK